MFREFWFRMSCKGRFTGEKGKEREMTRKGSEGKNGVFVIARGINTVLPERNLPNRGGEEKKKNGKN